MEAEESLSSLDILYLNTGRPEIVKSILDFYRVSILSGGYEYGCWHKAKNKF